jgi:transposase-like protein
MIKMKAKRIQRAMRPTIGACGRKNLGAVEQMTSSRVGSIGTCKPEKAAPVGQLVLGNVLPDEMSYKERLIEEFSVTGKDPKLGLCSDKDLHPKKLIRHPCPYCLRSNIVSRGKGYRKKHPKPSRRFECLNCKKTWFLTKFHKKKQPDYVIDLFIDLIEVGDNFLSSRKLSKIIADQTGYKLSHVTLNSWRSEFRKGKLFPFYIPNSRYNTLKKPDMKYIPKIVKYKTKRGTEATLSCCSDETRLKKAKEYLRKIGKTLIKAKDIRKAGGYSKNTCLSYTLLAQEGIVTQLGGGWWRINHEAILNDSIQT